MNIKELTFSEFSDFAEQHPLGNSYQTMNYALLKSEQGYEYEFVGYCENNTILAASLILYKKINNMYYGYAPRGFLIDYSNFYFLKNFTDQLKEYYDKKGFIFIKINPEIAIGKLNNKTKQIEYNDNYRIIDNLINSGYSKLKSNLYFESLLPRFDAIVNLNNFSISSVSKNTRNKIKKAYRKGLHLELADKDGIDVLYDLVKEKRLKDSFYYKDQFNAYNQNDYIDLFLVSIDYKEFLINSQEAYSEELTRNYLLNEKISYNFKSNVINTKMNSDHALLTYKNDITEASKKLNEPDKVYVAAALIKKYKNRISFEITGFDKNYKRFAPNYFLHYAILDYYKNRYKYADLNGVSGVFSKDSPYYGLNRFKMGFNPNIYEYIGEFDLIIDERIYDILLRKGYLSKEFSKENN